MEVRSVETIVKALDDANYCIGFWQFNWESAKTRLACERDGVLKQ